jgi:hypothetical protein
VPGTRAFRQRLGRLLRLARQYEWDSLSAADHEQLRVIVMPARLVVGFEQDAGDNVPFHTAVRNFIGLTHIRPPRTYGAAVENEAKADAVLDYLSSNPVRAGGRPRITATQATWYAGTINAAQVKRAKLPRHDDVRAAEIVRALLFGGRSTTLAVNRGIRSLTAEKTPRATARSDIAAELVLRPYRTAHPKLSRTDIVARRSALQRALRLGEITEQRDTALKEGFPNSAYTLEKLRDEALDDVRMAAGEGTALEAAQTELAVKAVYYMIIADTMALRREGYASSGAEEDEDDDDIDNRSIATVLRAMLSTERGVHQAYAVIVAGRARQQLTVVDRNGKPVHATDGSIQQLTDELVRHTYNNEAIGTATTGAAGAKRRWRELVASVDHLRRAAGVLAEVKFSDGSSQRWIDANGWPTGDIDSQRAILDKVSRALADWGDAYEPDGRGLDSDT